MSDYRSSHQSATQADAYDLEFQQDHSPSGILWQLERDILSTVLARISAQIGRSLDFACGTGRILEFVSRYVRDASGVDVSAEMLRHARKRAPGATLVEGDITRDPSLVPGPFDLVTAFRFFLGAQEELRHQALNALRDRISPEGWFICNFHRNPASLRGIYMRVRGAVSKQPTPFISLDYAVELLRAHRFEPEEVYGYQHMFYRSEPNGDPRRRRELDQRMWRMPALKRLGSSFLVVARPV
jgi:SAM-dependent methyltransferase